MLQIATGVYFDGGPMHETVHRAVFYTNAAALRPDPVDGPFGRLLFASGVAPITALTVEAVDRLPVNGPELTHVPTELERRREMDRIE